MQCTPPAGRAVTGGRLAAKLTSAAALHANLAPQLQEMMRSVQANPAMMQQAMSQVPRVLQRRCCSISEVLQQRSGVAGARAACRRQQAVPLGRHLVQKCSDCLGVALLLWAVDLMAEIHVGMRCNLRHVHAM